jgi:hypothetical protein
MKIHEPKDVTGSRLAAGDVVRVVGLSEVEGLAPDCVDESLPVFEHIIGRYYRIESFDEYGFAWLRFRIRGGPHAGMHGVAIEPYLLRKRRARRTDGQG